MTGMWMRHIWLWILTGEMQGFMDLELGAEGSYALEKAGLIAEIIAKCIEITSVRAKIVP